MPFFRIAPREVLDLYLKYARKHNDPATPAWERKDAQTRGYAICEMVTLLYGNVATGHMIMEADMTIDSDGDRPMCGGFYLDMDAPSRAAA